MHFSRKKIFGKLLKTKGIIFGTFIALKETMKLCHCQRSRLATLPRWPPCPYSAKTAGNMKTLYKASDNGQPLVCSDDQAFDGGSKNLLQNCLALVYIAELSWTNKIGISSLLCDFCKIVICEKN